jgi:hypothetical protein
VRLSIAILFTTLGFLAASGTAEALTVSAFTAHATSQKVFYAIHYCDRGARVHEHFDFYELDEQSGHFTDDAYVRVSGGCYIARGQFANRYRSGLWALKVTMSDSRGTLLHRAARVYLP